MFRALVHLDHTVEVQGLGQPLYGVHPRLHLFFQPHGAVVDPLGHAVAFPTLHFQ